MTSPTTVLSNYTRWRGKRVAALDNMAFPLLGISIQAGEQGSVLDVEGDRLLVEWDAALGRPIPLFWLWKAQVKEIQLDQEEPRAAGS